MSIPMRKLRRMQMALRAVWHRCGMAFGIVLQPI